LLFVNPTPTVFIPGNPAVFVALSSPCVARASVGFIENYIWLICIVPAVRFCYRLCKLLRTSNTVMSFDYTGYVCGTLSNVSTFVYVTIFSQHEPFVQKQHYSPVSVIQVLLGAFFALLHLLLVLIAYSIYKYIVYET